MRTAPRRKANVVIKTNPWGTMDVTVAATISQKSAASTPPRK